MVLFVFWRVYLKFVFMVQNPLYIAPTISVNTLYVVFFAILRQLAQYQTRVLNLQEYPLMETVHHRLCQQE